MQNLDVISFNVWQILISLCNLLILFLILKRFLYKPVKRAVEARQTLLNEQYKRASSAEQDALSAKKESEERLSAAMSQADAIISSAIDNANRRSEQIIDEARLKAGEIVRRANYQAELEKRKAESEIKNEIADVSALVVEKLIGREINETDHRKLIDSIISDIGEQDE